MKHSLTKVTCLTIGLLMLSGFSVKTQDQNDVIADPLLFCLVPHQSISSPRSTFGFMMETFNNQGTGFTHAPRGGDLALMETDGTVRLLTEEAGFGVASGEIQAEDAIVVREPTVHFSGCKALLSMMIGGPTRPFDYDYDDVSRWQIYEITNLCDVIDGAVANIVKVPGQPEEYSNYSAVYDKDDNIIFVSDIPYGKLETLYPRLDEYESATINSGVWKLDVSTEEVVQLFDAPSGCFDLFAASDGRILFTLWSHIQQDQQMAGYDLGNNTLWKPELYDTEAEDAELINVPSYDNDGNYVANAIGVPFDVFPSPRTNSIQYDEANGLAGHKWNEFQIWEMNPNGERAQTINHIGRHETGGAYTDGAFLGDNNLTDYESAGTQYTANAALRGRTAGFAGFFQITEDPRPGKESHFYMTYSFEFNEMASGEIFHSYIGTEVNPEDFYLTEVSLENDGTIHGHFRDVKIFSNGDTLVSHVPDVGRYNADEGRPYNFQLKLLKNQIPQDALTGDGFTKEIRWYGDFADPLSQEVHMLEVWPEPIIVREVPQERPEYQVDPIELQVMEEEGVDVDELRAWLIENDLALLAIRDVTKRDRADVQQPFNLRVPNGVESISAEGSVYDISHFQFFQGLYTKGYENKSGRRVFYSPLVNNTITHDNLSSINPYSEDGPDGSITIESDGSVAAFVPAVRSLSWRTVTPEGTSVIEERQPLAFAPGEIMTCPGCHGINKESHDGSLNPTNKPESLRKLLTHWKNTFGPNPLGLEDGFRKGDNGLFLYQNVPNPFTESTSIRYILPSAGEYTITIFNMMGQKIKTLVRDQAEKGEHIISWDGTNDYGQKQPLGVYISTINFNDRQVSNKLVIGN